MDFIRMKQKYAEVRARLLRGEIVWLEILNIRDDQGKTLLHLACEKGDVEFVRLLVNRGADINALDRYELTPIYIAVSFGFREIVKFLIDQDRIKLDLRTKKGVLQARLLSSAAILDDYTILMLLLQSGKITCLEDKDRITTDSPFDGNFYRRRCKTYI